MRAALSLFASLSLFSAGTALAVYQDITVHTGAVGIEERDALMRAYDDYNLHLGFAQKTGEFLADIDVTIRDAKGEEVWSGKTDGPMLFARLPQGRYTVIAEHEGQRQQRTVQAGSRPGPIHYLRW
jgi:hypothetical protein